MTGILINYDLGDRVNVAAVGVCTIVMIHGGDAVLTHLLGWKDGETPPSGPVDYLAYPMTYWNNPGFRITHGPLQQVPDLDAYTKGLWVKGNESCVLVSKGNLVPNWVARNGAPTGAPVNDHVCKHCQNTRVSRSEKNCWLCGGLL